MVWACDCQDYGQVDCERDEHCEPCKICIDKKCEGNYEICWDDIDNDCDGNTDEWCEDSCAGVKCYPPPDRECLNGDTLRYYLSPGDCIDGICRYESVEFTCQRSCVNDACTEDPCIGMPCDDGNPCTVDSCEAGTGCANTPYSCEDGDPCTDDVCHGDGTCTFALSTASCDDGDPCSMEDACSQGACSGLPLDEDGDGYVSSECGGLDCDDSYNTVYPGAVELCDGLDHNCDGFVDMVGTDLCNYEAFCHGRELVFCPEEGGPTDVPLVIGDDSVWCSGNSPFIHEDTTILAGVVLAVGPCVEIKAGAGAFINVRGELDVVGDEEYPAIFTSDSSEPTRGSWGGIRIQVPEYEPGSVSLFGAVVEFTQEGLDVNGCMEGCSVTIDGTTFRYNEMGLTGNLDGRTLEIKDSKFLGNACGSNQGDKIFRDCLFSGNDKGLCMAGGAIVIDSTVTENVVGLEGGKGRIENCYIANNTEYGVLSYQNGNSRSFELEGNTIIDNGIGVLVVDDHGYVAPVHNNVICDNEEYDVVMDTSVDLDATNNWWCSTDSEFISDRIHDVYDDANLGRVVFEPFLDEEPLAGVKCFSH